MADLSVGPGVELQSGRRFVSRGARRRVVWSLALLALAILVTPASGRAATPDSRLLAVYEPVTQFDPLERFFPTTVQSFIADASLEQLTASGAWRVVQAHPAAGDLPGPGSGTWRLNLGPPIRWEGSVRA